MYSDSNHLTVPLLILPIDSSANFEEMELRSPEFLWPYPKFRSTSKVRIC